MKKYTINEIHAIISAAIDRLGNDTTADKKLEMKNSIGAYTFGDWGYEFSSDGELISDFFDWFIN